MKISFIRRIREQVKIRNSHMEMMSDSPSSILEVREMIGTVMQPCKGITSSFSLFFF